MGELVVILTVVLVVVLVMVLLYRIIKDASRVGPLNDDGTIDENAVILTNIVIKAQKSKHDSGLYSVDRKKGLFAIFSEFEPNWETDEPFMKYIYKFTESEVQWLKCYGSLDGEELKVILRTPISDATFEKVVELLEKNQNLFQRFQQNNDRIEVSISG